MQIDSTADAIIASNAFNQYLKSIVVLDDTERTVLNIKKATSGFTDISKQPGPEKIILNFEDKFAITMMGYGFCIFSIYSDKLDTRLHWFAEVTNHDFHKLDIIDTFRFRMFGTSEYIPVVTTDEAFFQASLLVDMKHHDVVNFQYLMKFIECIQQEHGVLPK